MDQQLKDGLNTTVSIFLSLINVCGLSDMK